MPGISTWPRNPLYLRVDQLLLSLYLIARVPVEGETILNLLLHSKQYYNSREAMLQSLSEEIPVDVFGKCGNLTCAKSAGGWGPMQCDTDKIYKFYLSFENALCPDYVTEKFFDFFRYKGAKTNFMVIFTIFGEDTIFNCLKVCTGWTKKRVI